MVVLQFPDDLPRGTVEWLGSYSEKTGPVLAFGTVVVPDDQPVSLTVHPITGVQRQTGGGWSVSGPLQPSDLTFLQELPAGSINHLTVQKVIAESVPAIEHLAPGLQRLTLQWSELDDAALTSVARLTGLLHLQTFGNRFTDDGVQQLVTLTNLERLWLEEETLTAEAFRFARHLPRLQRLGLMDVPLEREELARLQADLPGVEVSD